MTTTLRAARADDDLDALNDGDPTWIGSTVIRDLFAASGDDVPTEMLVAEVDGVPAGYAHAVGHGFADGHRGIAHVHVLPAFRRRGVGGLLWQRVLAVCTPERVRGVMLQADDTDRETLALAEAHGLRLLGLHTESALDLASVEQHRDLATPPRGVAVGPLPDDADEGLWREFHEAFTRLSRDAPDVAAGGEDMPYDTLRSVVRQPWQVQVARRDGRLVGFTAVAVRRPDEGVLNTWFTGVDAAERGQGLATALKVSQALAVAERGWRTVLTQNMEGNEAILAANRRLGFVPAAGLRDVAYDHR
jgi:GNAT superfamily N-acetyltransferase